VAALLIVGVVASARGGVAVSSANIGGGQIYFVRVRGIFAILPGIVCFFYAGSGVVVLLYSVWSTQTDV
jgi:hypothetical protein